MLFNELYDLGVELGVFDSKRRAFTLNGFQKTKRVKEVDMFTKEKDLSSSSDEDCSDFEDVPEKPEVVTFMHWVITSLQQ